jgi:hypothetical protein
MQSGCIKVAIFRGVQRIGLWLVAQISARDILRPCGDWPEFVRLRYGTTPRWGPLRALGEAYHREDLHREVIRLYGRLGQSRQAEAHYARLAHELKEQFGIEPSPEARAAYHAATG